MSYVFYITNEQNEETRDVFVEADNLLEASCSFIRQISNEYEEDIAASDRVSVSCYGECGYCDDWVVEFTRDDFENIMSRDESDDDEVQMFIEDYVCV